MDEHPRPHPDAPETQAPILVPLRGDAGVAWQPVSPKLATARRISASAILLPFVVAGAVLAVLLWTWIAAIGAAVLALWLWLMWLIPLQVAAITWVELPEELAIRSGRLWRSLVTIPYGRIQYVDLSSGPLLRSQGLAHITVNTASPASSGDIPGLPVEVAERLRVRLSARGEALRAGL